MFNNRLIVASAKELFNAILSNQGYSVETYNATKIQDKTFKSRKQELISKIGEEKIKFLNFLVWFDVRNQDAELLVEALFKNQNKIKTFVVAKDYIKINDSPIMKTVPEVADYVHGNFPLEELKFEKSTVETEPIDHVPVAVGDGIKIYEVKNAQDARDLVGKKTTWCIGYPGAQNMWQSYRNTKDSTFFIVFDENPPTENQSMVALDFTKFGVELTDIPNNTGLTLSDNISFKYEATEEDLQNEIDEYNGPYGDNDTEFKYDQNTKTIYGNDFKTYRLYLKSKGIDLNDIQTDPSTGDTTKIFRNKPQTPEELIENLVINSDNIDLETVNLWLSGRTKITENPYDRDKKIFEKILQIVKNSEKYTDLVERWVQPEQKPYMVREIEFNNPDSEFYLSKHIGVGKYLDDEVFEYIWQNKSRGGEELLNKYVNTGLVIKIPQIEKIKSDRNLLNSYIRKQIQLGQQGYSKQMDLLVFDYLDPDSEEDRKTVDSLQGGFNLGSYQINEKWLEYPPFFSNLEVNKVINFYGFDKLNEIQKDIYTAIGKTIIYSSNPTVERTRLLLQYPESIDKLKSEALNQGYTTILLNQINPQNKYDNVHHIPEYILNLPEFEFIKNAKSASRYNYLSEDEKNNPEILKYSVLIENTSMVGSIDKNRTTKAIFNNKSFWLDLMQNLSNYANLLIDLNKSQGLMPVSLPQAIVRHLPMNLAQDLEILNNILNKGKTFVLMILQSNLKSFDKDKFDISKNLVFREQMKNWLLNADIGFFRDNRVNSFIEFAREFRRLNRNIDLNDFVVELIKIDPVAIIKLQGEKLINEDHILLFLDLYQNDERAMDLMTPARLSPNANTYQPLPIRIQQKIKTIPLLFERFKTQSPYFISSVLDERPPLEMDWGYQDGEYSPDYDYEDETKKSNIIEKYVKIAEKLDSRKLFKQADNITKLLQDNLKRI